MMKKTALFTCLLVFVISTGVGQTKKIFHKSHSGSTFSILLDERNNFGPGMAPVRYQTPESPIRLSYLDRSRFSYPKVLLDTIKKTMKFFDKNDSLIGCERDYREYLNHGSVVFDVSTAEFWVYQLYFFDWDKKQSRASRFLLVSDSISRWELQENAIRKSTSFIRDGNNFRILMSYPMLGHTITSNLKPELVNPPKSYPIKVGYKQKEKERKSKPIFAKEEKKKREIDDKDKKDNREEITIISTPKTPTFTRWLIWMGIFFFAFSAFIFLGVKHIVKDELNSMNFKK